MKELYLVMRSMLRWAASGIFFFVVCSILVLLAVLIDPRKNDRPQRMLSRNVLRLAGVGFEVRRSAGFDPRRTSFFVVNHVNLFDPFVLYSAIPQFVRGLELESHFKIPVYGWMMKRFGNVPVPDHSRLSDLKRMWRLTRAALDRGISLVVFPEGGRTRDGHVGAFKDGVFRMARQSGYPIVPVSIVGSYEFNRKGDWMLRPSKIVVYIHDTIEMQGLPKEEIEALRDRVHRLVSAPVEESLRAATRASR
ncbi:MAG TPA: lysophospholipid acyltransferase family protein [Candidatus Acidoferrales bacterium]|nr:lysophospholipid acyltransferase family protein [Candidatus Acidoferrales bacterium]